LGLLEGGEESGKSGRMLTSDALQLFACQTTVITTSDLIIIVVLLIVLFRDRR
jgi:hypothetical protein